MRLNLSLLSWTLQYPSDIIQVPYGQPKNLQNTLTSHVLCNYNNPLCFGKKTSLEHVFCIILLFFVDGVRGHKYLFSVHIFKYV